MKREERKVSSVVISKDLEDGQEYVTGFNYAVREPPFVKLYFQDIGVLHGLSKSDINVLHCFARDMYKDNTIFITVGYRIKVAEELDIRERTVLSALEELKSKNIMIKGTRRGSYIINPKLFIKALFKDIVNVVMHIQYDKKGRKFDVEFDKLPK